MAEGDDAVPSQVEIRCGCAFTYMIAVFRKNLTEALDNRLGLCVSGYDIAPRAGL